MLLFFQQRFRLIAQSQLTVPFLCSVIFTLGCLLHLQRGYFNSPPNFLHVIGTDDAYITFRYGWNLVHHGILSWNESGFRQTEGFTNPLWVFLSAAWALTNNKDHVYPGVAGTSIFLTAVLLSHMAYRVRKNNTSNVSLIGILLISCSPILWSHTTSGMESGMFGALLGLSAYIVIFEKDLHYRYLPILVFITVILRSDGFAYVTILLIAGALTKSHYWKHVALGLLIGITVLFLWRMLTFGLVIPNTAVAKLNFPWVERIGPGMLRLVLLSPGFIPLIIIGLQAMRSMCHKQQIAAGLVLAGWIAYYIYIGGDTYQERHILGIVVLLSVMAPYQFDRLVLPRKQLAAIILIFIAFMFLPLMLGDARFQYWNQKPHDPWIRMGNELSKDRDKYGVIVIAHAGKIPFFAGGNFVDELGLNDPDLAAIKREEFIPGHSAGSRFVAFQIAQSQKVQFCYFIFGNELTPEDEGSVILWIDNIHPNSVVQHSISKEIVAAIMTSHPLGYTLLIDGIAEHDD